MSAAYLLELLKQRERNKAPLVVFHNSPTLPVTPQSVISAAEAAGRMVIHVRFVSSVTDTLPELDVENRESAERSY
jgi:hypothetical protein